MIDKVKAIQSLRPDAGFVLRGDELEWHDTNQTQPTESEIQAEITRLQAEYDANQYQRDRATQYKPVTDQLDMLWHAIDTGTLDKTCDFYTVNKTVKDNNPKE